MRDNITLRLSRLLGAGGAAIARGLGASGPQDGLDAALARADRVVAEAQAELGRLIAKEHEARKRLAQSRAECDASAETVESLIRAGKDTEARNAVARGLDHEFGMPALIAEIAATAEQRAALDAALNHLIERRRAMADDVAAVREAGAGEADAARLAEIEHEFVAALETLSRAPDASDAMRGAAAGIASLRREERLRMIEDRFAAARAGAGE